jgi:hypothetical protein
VVSGAIQDAKTMTALTLYANRQRRGGDNA